MSGAALPLARGGMDRDAVARTDPALFDRLWAEPGTRVLVLHEGRAPIRGGDLHWISPEEVPNTQIRAYLGRVDGAARVAVSIGEGSFAEFSARPELSGAVWDTVRNCGAELTGTDATALVTATALLHWHETSRFCPACGMPLGVAQGGWVRQCFSCGHIGYPRIEPAVIMAVETGDRLLLASHQASTDPSARFSVLAGFVEPGETLEQAVARETAEEVGLRVDAVHYLASQSWPYPLSLMVAFRATALAPIGLRPDGEEILQARWVSREELRAGALRLPGPASVARAMIEDWVSRDSGEARGRR
ncbi:MAG: NAD(+) diphosphatase [Microbacteriaceae bacterium]|jgi:NAD+ diphosphatase|nr:NAD(+) diphosphatase [Microbacteriaceae bacterium]